MALEPLIGNKEKATDSGRIQWRLGDPNSGSASLDPLATVSKCKAAGGGPARIDCWGCRV